MNQLNNFFFQIFETKKMLVEWIEAKMMILRKKGDKDIKYYRPVCLLSNIYNRYYKNEWKRLLIKTSQENRPVSEKITR